jgi:hypothetical protein
MNSRRTGQGVALSVAMLMLLGANAAFASSSQSLTFAVGSPTLPLGTVSDLGNQQYQVRGGHVFAAYLGGNQIDGAIIQYSMNANVKSTTAKGSGSFDLTGTIAGQPVSVSGEFSINSAQTIAQVLPNPSGVCRGNGAKSCSELPVTFGGPADLKIQAGGSTTNDVTTMQVENPYFNPLGGPIFLVSGDQSVFIIATYSVGTIQWSGAAVTGPISGVLGSSTPVSGTLTLNSNEQEDLVAGTAADSGSISFSSMTPSILNLGGSYSGTSTIPSTGSFDCSALFTFPAGTCTATGFSSSGSYTMKHGQTTVSGTYSTEWTVPALAFSSTGSATLTQK